MAINPNNPTSRLLTSTESLRQTLVVRNLYTPAKEYPDSNQTNVDKTVATINTIIQGIAPFKSFDLSNTVYGRLITTQTPLTTIGLVMLGKQFALNAMSGIAQDNFPIIKPSNLFDNNKSTKLFTLRKDYSITVKSGSTSFSNFLRSAVYYYPSTNNPFSNNPINSDYIKNTGSGQLQLLYQALNKNIYKQATGTDNTFRVYANKVKEPVQPRSNLINIGKKVFYNFGSSLYDPYNPLGLNSNSTLIISANKDMINAMNNEETTSISSSSEYAPNKSFVKFNFGDSVKENDIYNIGKLGTQNDWINPDTEFINDNTSNKIVWGRDGIDSKLYDILDPLRGNFGEDIVSNDPLTLQTFNVRGGLLEYTRNLVKATNGKIGDLTRKAFTDEDKIVGFNGSGLWKSNSSNYATTRSTSTAGKTGVRQHSAVDQYDRFAKAIRFDGNKLYNGNPNSVIYNTVLPRIHPIIDNKGKIDNKNLMFSIENLAVRVISKGDVGIIDDEYGSQIPASEVGAFNGRVMWFPPYALELQETALAKYESTVMVGRNEPMYNYQNSERTATVSFMMLIDYPPQVRNYDKSKNQQKDVAEFFAFGGDPDKTNKGKYVENLQLKLASNIAQADKIQKSGIFSEPEIIKPTPISIYFPNDVPNVNDNINTIIDKIYDTYRYEIVPEFISCDGGHFGLNQSVYFITGLTNYVSSGNTYWGFPYPPLYSQYTSISTSNQFGEIALNKALKDVFDNEDYRKYYNIEIVGAASKLYTENNPNDIQQEQEYNYQLGLRRANATKVLIEKRLEAMYGKTISQLGINIITTSSAGSTNASTANATAAAIPLREAKEERSALISFVRNSTPLESKDIKMTPNEKADLNITLEQINSTQTLLNNTKTASQYSVMNERTDDKSAILHGFQSIKNNYYSPVFHSQTPEDFHKRLTFLHQCTRQGAAKHYTADVDSNGILRSRNSVFGRQPICILRVGDFFYTKVIIESVNFDYTDTTWDNNPEGRGSQPMIVKITLTMKLIGGQSLKGPIDALQNAVSFNYYANSNFNEEGMYILPSRIAKNQEGYINGILATETKKLTDEYDKRQMLINLATTNGRLY